MEGLNLLTGTPHPPTVKLGKDNKLPVSSSPFEQDLQHYIQCLQESGSHYRHCPPINGLNPPKLSLLVENETVTVLFHFYQMTRKRDSLEAESRSVVASGWQ